MANEPVKVTVSDPATGEVLGERIIENDYILVCAGRVHLEGTTAYPNTGTHVLTIKGVVGTSSTVRERGSDVEHVDDIGQPVPGRTRMSLTQPDECG